MEGWNDGFMRSNSNIPMFHYSNTPTFYGRLCQRLDYDQRRRTCSESQRSILPCFRKLDIKNMEKVWAKAVHVECGHPGWRVLRGWDAVMESWKRIFENTPAIQFMLTDISIQIHGTMAWVTLYENLNEQT